MPAEPIQVIYRSDASGTTDNFQQYLQAASGGAWTKGAGKKFLGGVGTPAAGNEGTSAAVKNTEGAITYNEWSFAIAQNLQAADIKTSAGSIVHIGDDFAGKTITAAKIVGQGNDLVLDLSGIYNPTQAGAYPIVLASYEIVCSKYPDAEVGKAVKAFMQATITTGQTDLNAIGYIPLPPTSNRECPPPSTRSAEHEVSQDLRCRAARGAVLPWCRCPRAHIGAGGGADIHTRAERRTSSNSLQPSVVLLRSDAAVALTQIRSPMNVVNGLPAHVLLVHFMVVLVPLTAVLEIVCALWGAARRRLVWLVLILAAVTMVLTPLTIDAGEWLFNLRKDPSPILREHADRGELMTYFSVALLLVAILLVVLHILESRSDERRVASKAVMALVAIAVGIASMVQIYRVGDAGSQSVWGDEITHLKQPNGD